MSRIAYNNLYQFYSIYFSFILDIAELKSFITDQVDSLHKKINRVHRSLIYDQNKKFEEIKKLITLNAPAVEEDQNTASITAVMPIKSIKKFLEFEDELSSDVAKQQSLVWIRFYLYFLLITI